MPGVQRTRFERWLKNLTGFRGPMPMNLDAGIAPVYDVGRSDGIELDDEQAFFYGQNSQAAVAAQFQAIQLVCTAGRAVIDQVWVRPVAAAAGVRIGRIGAVLAAPTSTAVVSVRNAFLGQPIGTLGAVTLQTFSQAADPLAAQTILQTDTPTAGASAIAYNLQMVALQGAVITFSNSVVNLGISIGVIGRWLADQT
jgi:hypothetical protein